MSQAKEYPGIGISVLYDAGRCIHAAECVRALPRVFDPQARPWIRPGDTAAATLAETVERCPTGALQVRWADGRGGGLPGTNEAHLSADGPVYLRGDIALCETDGSVHARETRMALCRCGGSANKPYCDGSHSKLGFRDAGLLPAGAPAAQAGGELRLTPIPDGPAMLEGTLTLVGADGTRSGQAERCWLCRCGASANKPYCDGSHKRVGFKS